jgi:glyoxylase-like metal-dependent hydrolase (beta-lactamase superfamily II)
MSLSVGRIVLSRYGSNTYLLAASEEADEIAVVDPGGDPGPLLRLLQDDARRVAGILVTHTDVDHIEGVGPLADETGAPVWAPAAEAEALRDGSARGGLGAVPAHPPEHLVEDGDTVEVAGMSLDVVAVPGHSAGHVAFCTEGRIFSGDVLFEGSVGRVDLPGGDWDMLLASIKRLVDRFGPDAIVYPGHGEPTTLGREVASNPFLGELRAR